MFECTISFLLWNLLVMLVLVLMAIHVIRTGIFMWVLRLIGALITFQLIFGVFGMLILPSLFVLKVLLGI